MNAAVFGNIAAIGTALAAVLVALTGRKKEKVNTSSVALEMYKTAADHRFEALEEKYDALLAEHEKLSYRLSDANARIRTLESHIVTNGLTLP